MGKRSSNPNRHSQDMAESAARIHRSIGLAGLATVDAGVILRDIETLVSTLATVSDDIKNICTAWHGSREMRSDSVKYLREHLGRLKTAMETARHAAHHCAFALEHKQDPPPLPEATGAAPAEAASNSDATNGRKSKSTTSA